MLMPVFSAGAFMAALRDKDCEEAIAFGREHRDTIEDTLDRQYLFGNSSPFAEGGTIHTKWYKLALMAALASRTGEALTAAQRSAIMDDPYLQINVTVYGKNLDFAKGYTAVMVQKGSEIKPDKIHADHFMNSHSAKQSQAGFPACWAIIRAYFRYATLDPGAAAVLIIRKDGNESRFEIDFSRYK